MFDQLLNYSGCIRVIFVKFKPFLYKTSHYRGDLSFWNPLILVNAIFNRGCHNKHRIFNDLLEKEGRKVYSVRTLSTRLIITLS